MLSKPITYFLIILVLIAILLGYISPAIALLIGMISGMLQISNNGVVQNNIKFQKYLLQISVVGLGFGINIQEALVLGSNSFFLSLVSIVFTFIIAITFAKLFKSEKITTLLVASGTAICGGSAIAAVSPCLKANSNQTSIALAIVFLLNAIALFIFPSIGHYFNLSQSQFGLWCAIAIHDTSSVVGASALYGSEALNVATTTKLVRTLWIIPLVLILSFGSDTGKNIKFPWFILAFLGAMLLSSYVVELQPINDEIVWLARKLLIFTLFLIGLQINLKQLKKLGFSIIGVGVLTWIILGVLSLFYILNYTL